MIIQDILKQLETSTHPVAKAIHKGDHFKVLAIAFKKGMILKEHKTSNTAKLTVLSGSVIYHQNEIHQLLHQYEEVDIPTEVIHSVECTQDAICLLTQG
jgi:quercetin dioxygenase-like cupin family protein